MQTHDFTKICLSDLLDVDSLQRSCFTYSSQSQFNNDNPTSVKPSCLTDSSCAVQPPLGGCRRLTYKMKTT